MGREFSTPAPPSGSISFRLELFHPFCLLLSDLCFLFCPFCPLVSLLFPINSKLPLRQLLCFDNHANCRGWVGGPLFCFPIWNAEQRICRADEGRGDTGRTFFQGRAYSVPGLALVCVAVDEAGANGHGNDAKVEEEAP